MTDSPAEKSAHAEQQAALVGPRLFFAIEISDEVRTSVSEVVGDMQKGATFAGSNPKWVSPESYHVTLWFLGNVHPETAGRLKVRLKEAVADVPPFKIDVRHIGVFPNPNEPRVLWIGLYKPGEALMRLHRQCEAVMRKCGIKPDPGTDFTPHVTLARLKGVRKVHDFAKSVEAYRHAKCGKCMVTRLVLMESKPQKGGAVYTPWQVAELTAVEEENPGTTGTQGTTGSD